MTVFVRITLYLLLLSQMTKEIYSVASLENYISSNICHIKRNYIYYLLAINSFETYEAYYEAILADCYRFTEIFLDFNSFHHVLHHVTSLFCTF